MRALWTRLRAARLLLAVSAAAVAALAFAAVASGASLSGSNFEIDRLAYGRHGHVVPVRSVGQERQAVGLD